MMSRLKSSRALRVSAIIVGVAISIGILLGVFWYGVGYGWWGPHSGPGEITQGTIPSEIIDTRAAQNMQAANAVGLDDQSDQILFGDWHAHTTFSSDAYRMSLPQMQGEGAHPPADACDFARYCSAIDFWALTDHAEHITPRDWKESVETIRQCNALTDPKNPDVVAFIGWEWTQQSMVPTTHYGHKNVVLKGIGEDEVTARPIAPGGITKDVKLFFPPPQGLRDSYKASGFDPEYLRFSKFTAERMKIKDCAEDVESPNLPADCRENADTPEILFRKLDEWEKTSNVKSVVIPHGTTWGMYTPPTSDWRKQLTPQDQDPKRQTLFEVFSGHGNSEEYRSWRPAIVDADGKYHCPAPSQNFMPGCWRAGEIIAERCLQAKQPQAECDKRAAEARQNYVDVASIGGYLTVAGSKPVEWQDSEQCRDCFMPTFSMRPLASAQYVMAMRNFDVQGEPMRFDFGFIASSDGHKARPGTGYKAYDRRQMTEAGGKPTGALAKFRLPPSDPPVPQSRVVKFGDPRFPIYGFVELERANSFFSTGGLMAVHANGRSRDAIWNAVQNKNTYATSGPRILLWFNLLNAPSQAADANAPQGTTKISMGSHVTMTGAPQFEVKAVGAYKQKPGCPDFATKALSKERLDRLCRGECYNPSDERMLITRIEVIRIRPQNAADEPIDNLIEDPWKTIACKPDPNGCTATFDDPEFVRDGRDSVYYVRAIQEPELEINGDGLGCKTRGTDGRCLEVNICGLDKSMDDDCLSPVEERAWSSPILIDTTTRPTGKPAGKAASNKSNQPIGNKAG